MNFMSFSVSFFESHRCLGGSIPEELANLKKLSDLDMEILSFSPSSEPPIFSCFFFSFVGPTWRIIPGIVSGS